ncbi:hypothetical protein NDU88_005710 [Pleurodeles waltl]|uniref:Uncharacterized protein n=1 Tax=Pleurodeles waltl TaxID=8319 RepID=A0AAV7SMG3_PLEWA|nr:hypothetical protein NDU88_005710 [Pleurodeles waltl]
MILLRVRCGNRFLARVPGVSLYYSSVATATGQEILETLPAITTSDGAEGDNSLNEFESTLLRLDKHFLPKVSIILQRYYFGKRKQTDDESIEDFVTALRKLASSCNFGENLEERIRDQFMLECKCDKVREALWAKNDPSLDELVSPTVSPSFPGVLGLGGMLGELGSTGGVEAEYLGGG